MNDLRKAPFVGRSIPRREDHRLLTGRGQFIADLDAAAHAARGVRAQPGRACAHPLGRPVARRRGAGRGLRARAAPSSRGCCRRCRTRSSRCRANGRRWCSTSSSIRSSRCSPTTRSAMSARRSRSSWPRAATPPRMRRNWSALDLDPLPAVVDPEAALRAGRADHPREIRHQPDRRLHHRQGRDRRRARARAAPARSAASIITATPPRRWSAAASSASMTRAPIR